MSAAKNEYVLTLSAPMAERLGKIANIRGTSIDEILRRSVMTYAIILEEAERLKLPEPARPTVGLLDTQNGDSVVQQIRLY